ncbi:hypothetical protein K450DRAFT_236892 [Umbelopsis ramanniana AG]|uniref:SH3 domain-containing protein n=1 Tax=Umbelopsis ramanniana AG TaxID=1314678 RepID=A0AAD5EBR4_UMBRA|nr:uncharacterized protein K450DRAFT_236892 [Umbelopsis ramanniana AG]KAI8580407.1 hypothetical protein K450DRAFT_236892 [Umbelopsis ramanniana AG]
MSEQQPNAAQRYKAHHTYEAQRDDELTLMKGDIVNVTDLSDPDWWVGETANGKSGYFPSNFVDPVSDSQEQNNSEDATEGASEEPAAAKEETGTTEEAGHDQKETPQVRVIGLARVMEDYAMQEPGEITLHKGVIVNVLEDNGEYMKGEVNGKVGTFPSKYVEFNEIPGQPEFGRPSSMSQSVEEPDTESRPKSGFRLAAYGVKQGGIGSLLAGGIPVLRPSGAKKTQSQDSISKQEAQVSKPPPATPKSPAENASPSIPEVSSPQSIGSSTPATPPARSEPTSAPVAKGIKGIVTHHYDPDQEDELTLMKGEYVTILERESDDGWWKGVNERGEIGVFPSNFVKEITEETPPPPPTRTSKRMSSSTESAQKSPVVGSARPPLARPPSIPGGSRPSSYASMGNRPSSISENAPLSSPPPLPSSPSPARTFSMTSNTSARSQGSPIVSQTKSGEANTAPFDAEPEDIKSPSAIQPIGAPVAETDFSDVASDVPSSMAVEVSSSVAEEPIDEPEEDSTESNEKIEPEAQSEPAPVVEEELAPTPAQPEEVEPVVEGEAKTEVEAEQPVEDVAPAVVESEKQPENAEVAEVATENDVVEEHKEEEDTKLAEPIKDDVATAEAAEEEPSAPVEPEEVKPDFDSITSGPKLAGPNRARPSRSRRPQESKPSEPSQTALLEEEVAKQPEEKAPVEEKAAPAPPAKPIKPIFQKFPTPFAGADASARTLKPVQRRMWEPAEATQESSSSEKKAEEKKEEPARGVKNISSRFNFAGVPSGGGNEVLETKLRNHTKNEVEKARKDLERQLSEEREERKRLEEKVADLSAKLEALMAQIGEQ